MERIHFQEANTKILKWLAVLFFLASVPMVFDYLKIIKIAELNTKIYLLILSLLPILIFHLYSIGLGYKNFVYWNKKGMYFRIHSFVKGYNINFEEISRSDLQDDKLVIYEKDKEKRIDLSKIRLKDRKKCYV